MKYYVYILTNKEKTVLYTGITNDLEQRIIEHYTKGNSTYFTNKYRCCYLPFYEGFNYINNAIAREKEINGWRKEKKLDLIRVFNPALKLLKELFGEWPPRELTSR